MKTEYIADPGIVYLCLTRYNLRAGHPIRCVVAEELDVSVRKFKFFLIVKGTVSQDFRPLLLAEYSIWSLSEQITTVSRTFCFCEVSRSHCLVHVVNDSMYIVHHGRVIKDFIYTAFM